MPHPTPLKDIGVSYGSPPPTLHSPYHPLRSLPCSLVGLKQDAVGGVLSMASSALCGSPVVTQGRTGLPGSPRAKRDDDFALAFLPAVPGLVSFDWLTSQARYVRVFIPRKAMHASGRLAMASLSQALLLGDLLSPHSAFQEHAAHGVEWSTPLSSKGSWGTCIPQGGTTFLLRAFTAHHLTKQRLINELADGVNERHCRHDDSLPDYRPKFRVFTEKANRGKSSLLLVAKGAPYGPESSETHSRAGRRETPSCPAGLALRVSPRSDSGKG